MSGRSEVIAFKDRTWGYSIGAGIPGTGKTRIAFSHMSVDDRRAVEAILREHETADDDETGDRRYFEGTGGVDVEVVPYQPLRCDSQYLNQVYYRAPMIELVPKVVIGYFEILDNLRSIALELTDGILAFMMNNPDNNDFEDFYEHIFSKLNRAYEYRNKHKLLAHTNPLNAYVKPIEFEGGVLASNIKCLIMNMLQFHNHGSDADAGELGFYVNEGWLDEWVDEPVVRLKHGPIEGQWVCGYQVEHKRGTDPSRAPVAGPSSEPMETDANTADAPAANPPEEPKCTMRITTSQTLRSQILSGHMAPVRFVDKPRTLAGITVLKESEALDLSRAPGLLHAVDNGLAHKSVYDFCEGLNVKQYIYFNPPDNRLNVEAVGAHAKFQKARGMYVAMMKHLEEVSMALEGDRDQLPSDVNSLLIIRDRVIKALDDVFVFKHDHGRKLGALGYSNPFDAMIYVLRPYVWGKVKTYHVYGNIKCGLLLLHQVIAEKGGYDYSDTDPDEWMQIPQEWRDEWIDEKVFLVDSKWFCGLKIMKDGV